MPPEEKGKDPGEIFRHMAEQGFVSVHGPDRPEDGGPIDPEAFRYYAGLCGQALRLFGLRSPVHQGKVPLLPLKGNGRSLPPVRGIKADKKEGRKKKGKRKGKEEI